MGMSDLHQKKSLKKYSTCKTSAFYMRNPFKIHFNHKQIGFNFTKELPLKLSRTKQKSLPKIELTFNFTKEIHVKITRKKKKKKKKKKPKKKIRKKKKKKKKKK